MQRRSEDALQEDLARFGLVDGRVKPPAKAEDSTEPAEPSPAEETDDTDDDAPNG